MVRAETQVYNHVVSRLSYPGVESAARRAVHRSVARGVSTACGFAFAVAWAGCIAQFQVPDDARIACASNADCPSPWTCNTDILECQKILTQVVLPEPEVVFTSPRDGETDVSLQATVLLIFSMPVVESSLDGRIHLKAGSDEVPVTRTSLATGAAYELTPQAGLAEGTHYTLTVDVGVEGDIANSTPSTVVRAISFDTATLLERDPPGPVRDLVVDVRGPGDTLISWTNPTDADLAGVMILRRADAGVAALPTDGVVYGVNAFVDTAQVVQVVDAVTTSWIDTIGLSGAADYAIFAFDRNLNYSHGRSPPLVADVTYVSCAESGTITATAATGEAGSYQVLLTDSAGVAPTVTFPLTATTPLGTGVVLGNAGLAPGTRYDARVKAGNADGVRIGAPAPYWWLPSSLAPLSEPVPIAAGGTAELLFMRYGWTEFEAEVDDDTLPGVVGWTAADISPGGAVTATKEMAGEYQFRVRPTRSGCAVVDWTVSQTFNVDNVVYVSPSGSDADTGVDPAHAVRTLQRANDLVDGYQSAADLAGLPRGVEVRAAVGTYSETLTPRKDGRYLGGFEPSDFRSRYDPRDALNQANDLLSRIQPGGSASSARGIYYAGAEKMTASTVLDGFDIEAVNTGSVHYGIDITGGATITHNVIRGGDGVSSWQTYALTLRSLDAGTTALIADNVIDDGIGYSTATHAVSASGAGGEVVIRNNVVTGVRCVLLSGVVATVEDNDLRVKGMFNSNASDRTGISTTNSPSGAFTRNTISGSGTFNGNWYGMDLDGTVRVEGNVIYPQGGAAGSTSTGIHASAGGAGEHIEIVNNFIHGGFGSSSRAIDYGGGKIWIVNNTLFAGAGSDSQVGISLTYSLVSYVTIVNNLFFGDSAVWVAIERKGSGSVPAALQNNVAIGTGPSLPAAFFRDLYANPDMDYDAVDTQTLLCGLSTPAPAALNALVTVAPQDAFVNLRGGDGNLDTLEDNDWHLATTDPAITEAGRDASTYNCGAFGTGCPSTDVESCADVIYDIDYLPAPAAAVPRAAPYSVGADEVD